MGVVEWNVGCGGPGGEFQGLIQERHRNIIYIIYRCIVRYPSRVSLLFFERLCYFSFGAFVDKQNLPYHL